MNHNRASLGVDFPVRLLRSGFKRCGHVLYRAAADHGLNFLFHSFGRQCNLKLSWTASQQSSPRRPCQPGACERLHSQSVLGAGGWNPVVFGLWTRSALAAGALLLAALLFGTSLRGDLLFAGSSRSAFGPVYRFERKINPWGRNFK
jgi:hypothetical protein